MRPTKNNWIGAAVIALAAITAAGSLAVVSAQQRPRGGQERTTAARATVDPQADRVLRGMSQYLQGLRAFRVSADSALEVVLENGQKLQFVAASQVVVRRPDRLRSERRGAQADAVLYYDGDSVTLFGRRQNVWATTEAPRALDEMIEFARDDLDIEAPAADLLASDVYATLMEDVRSGMYVGQEEVGGVSAHHLAFRNRGGTDWQIWVQDGATPLPVRYVVVSTDVQSDPQFEVALHDWDTRATVSDADFAFEAPPGARQIEFLGARQVRDAARARERRRIEGGR